MEARELRIGNRVYANNVGTHPSNSFAEQKVIESGSDIDNAQWWMPIPLTEDWLVKLGFVVHKGGSFDRAVIGDRYVFFIWRPNNTFQLLFTYQGMQLNPETPIKYVHQLQNLYFALTGTELEIK